MNKLYPILSLLIAMSVLNPAQAADADLLRLEDPWIREAPPNARSLAGYLVLHNDGKQSVEIVAVHADGFGHAMMHETVIENGMARMKHLHTIEVPAGGSLTFGPGGRHLMLMRPEHSFKEGDQVRVCLEAADGSLVEFDYPVRRAQQ